MLKSLNSSILKLGITTILFLIGSLNITNKHSRLSAATITTPHLISDLPNTTDGAIYRTIIDRVTKDRSQPSMGELVQTVATQFLGAEYQAGLLDRVPQETLVISLQQFDCLLFVETVLAIASNLVEERYSYQAFTEEVEDRRYWNGRMNGYCSRLHYFSDWIEDNQKRDNVQNITSKLGGINTVKKLDFMTTHRSSYSNLATSEANFKCIARVEASLSPDFNYIPTSEISRVYSRLQPGDIIGVVTDIAGLDFTHTGFAYRHSNGEIGLIHASPAGEVVIAADLQNYIANVENAIGIVVTRAN